MKTNYEIIQDRKIRLGLVGCGRIAKNHIQAIEAHQEDLELIAIHDESQDVLANVEKEFPHAKTYSKLQDLLNNPEIDAVTLCTPSGLHPIQTMKVARAGKHVITEKPMATRWQDALDMVRVCDEEVVRLFVVKQNRHNATLQVLKRAIDSGRFGRIYMVTTNVFWTRPQEYYNQAKWRGTWEYDGGAFMNQASHYVDLLHWLIGPVASVTAVTGTLARTIDAEDTGVMTIRWRSGAMGSVNVTMLTYPKNYEGSITIIGEKGTVRIGGMALNKVEHWEFADEHPDDDLMKKASYETSSVYGFGHTLYYQNVIDVLRGKAEPETDGRSGLKSLELLIAAYLSARDGCSVNLPLQY